MRKPHFDNQRVPMVVGRERSWRLVIHGDAVVVINYLVLEDGEDINDSPPEEQMSRAEFARRHAEFGLDPDGKPL